MKWPFTTCSDKSFLWTIVLVALLVRLFFLWFFGAYNISPGEGQAAGWSFGYEAGRIAKSLANGNGFSSPLQMESGPTAWLMPGYPLLLAAIFMVFGIYTEAAAIATLVLNSVLSALTCLPVFGIGKIVFGRKVGLLTSAGFAVYPPSIWHAINTIWDTTIFTFLATLLVARLITLPEKTNWRTALGFGAHMGLAALFNAVILALYPFVMVWIWLRAPFSSRTKAKALVIMGAMTLTVLSPWIARNYVVFGKPMLRSNFGLEFSLGNNERMWSALKSTPWSIKQSWIAAHPTANKEELRKYVSSGEISYFEQCLDKGLRFIKDNPEGFIALTLARIKEFWLGEAFTVNEWAGNLRLSFSVSWMKKLCILLPMPFMLLGILQVFRKGNLNGIPLLAYLFFMPLVYYITNVFERYRFPIEPVMLLFACYGFCVLANWVRGHAASFLDRIRGNWGVGVMEYWSNGECKSKSIISRQPVPLCAGLDPQRNREKD